MIRAMVLDLLFPPKCILCGELLKKDETDLCRHCRVETREFPRSSTRLSFLDSWASVWYYEENIRHSLHRYKFRNARHYAAGYGRILAMRLLREYPEGFDALTWIPISPARQVKRGYDQVECLAKAVGKELDMKPVRTMRKIRNNPPQSGITGQAQRKANVLGVYRAVKPERVRGKRVLLLDDIITTGSTASEAARILLTSGAKEVHLGCLAAARKK